MVAGELTAAELRREIAARPLRPYESFETTLQLASDDFKKAVDRTLQRAAAGGPKRPPFQPPIAWDDPNRSKRYRDHSWYPIGTLLRAHTFYGDDAPYQAALGFARDWYARFQQGGLHRSVAELLAVDPDADEAFAWYDMAVGQRAYRLAYLLDVAARDARIADAEIDDWMRSLRLHIAVLAEPSFFRGHNNHGLYQALGHVAAARRFEWLPGFAEQMALGQARLKQLIADQYFEEGPHSEHSPGYHYMILGSLLGARASGIVDGSAAETLGRAEEVLGWMVTPSGRLPMIGDTNPKPVHTPAALTGNYSNPGVLHLLTEGELGSPPPSGVKAYPRSGYAFARMYPEGGDPAEASHLTQFCGFHSRSHKHADHLGFVWDEGRRTILADPGRFGYLGKTKPGDGLYEQGFWYSDPRRRYVESTRAHNCVEIDGADYPRARVTPFGSALRSAELQGGLVVFDSALRHEVGVLHRRTLILDPSHFLVVLDWMGDDASAHALRQWFTFAPEWEVSRVDAGYRARAAERTLNVVDLLGDAELGQVQRGEESPLQGWVSDKGESLVPATSIHLGREMTGAAAFATLFSLSGEAIRDERTRLADSGRAGFLAWTTEAGEYELTLARGEDDRMAVTLERSLLS